MSRNPSPRQNQNNQTWGLSVPGRPNTPSEGFAQVSFCATLGNNADKLPRRIIVSGQQQAKKQGNLTMALALPLVPM